VRILYLTDRLSERGGADLHLRQVIEAAAGLGHRVTVAFGRPGRCTPLPTGVSGVRVRGLTTAKASRSGLGNLENLVHEADLVHAQNVMNPEALEIAATAERMVVTIQDHRIFCPGPGRTLPDGKRCRATMSDELCRQCLEDEGYRQRLLALTSARLRALRGARLVVLSRYMADELSAAGMPDALVLPPWVEVGNRPATTGSAFVLAGRLVRHKAPLDGWRAWRASGSTLPLEVAGAGPLESELTGARLLGWLDQGALAATLHRGRALLFPARWQEPFGILGVQALAQGTPVIVADSGGTNEWSDRGCVVVPPGDVGAIAEAVAHLADDPQVSLKLGREGRSMVADRFSRPLVEAGLRRLYADLG
jgi:glycosyltransferase involved in cell wall biosynthesis